MTDFSVAVSSVALGGRAVLNLDTLNAGQLVDVNSIRVRWYDNLGVLLSDLTRTVSDVASTDIYGNAVDLIDISGTGTYASRLVIDSTNYSPPANGLRWSAVVTITYTVGMVTTTFTKTFYATIVATTLDITFDQQNIATAAMRQAGILVDVNLDPLVGLTYIPLRSGAVYDILAAYKNGTVMARPTDYTWQMFRTNVTLVVASAAGDNFHFTLQNRSSEIVNDVVVRMLSEFNRNMRPHYDSATVVQSPDAVEIVKSLVIGQLKQDIAAGSTMDNAFWRSGYEQQREARKAIIRLQRGEDNLYDSGGVALVRTDGAIVGAAFRDTSGSDGGQSTYAIRRFLQLNGVYSLWRPDPDLGLAWGAET